MPFVVKWLALLPHGKDVLRSNPSCCMTFKTDRPRFCVEFTFPYCACMAFPHHQNMHIRSTHRLTTGVHPLGVFMLVAKCSTGVG